MNTISESVSPWRPTVELAVAPNSGPGAISPEADGSEGEDGFKMFGDDGFTFLDFIDIINPLQHIPVVGTIYRQLTDDTLDPGSRVIGGSLFFGPVGTVVSLANVLVDDATGKDLGEHALALFDDDYKDAPETVSQGGETVADVGRRADSFGPPPGTPQAPATAGTVDPITAWARSEIASRKSTPEDRGAFVMEKADLAPEERGALVEEVIGDVAGLTPEERGALVEEFVGLPTVTAPASGHAIALPTGAAPGWKGASPYAPPAPIAVADAGSSKNIDVLEWATAVSTLREAKQSAALYTAKTYEKTPVEQSEKKASQAPQATTQTPPHTPPGALAPEGGWFSETMLTALGRYKEGANLSGEGREPTVDLRR
ncbi:MAG: hypothetical protein HQ512_15465 [Rhodospirillales bacterium]|nr:hypothetical protein [Rhodospirillales bacterium]